jgi:peroxiredoxin
MVAGVSAQVPAPADVAAIGPKVGDRVQDFTLKDANGRTRSLKSAAGPKGTMLVFFRSADW